MITKDIYLSNIQIVRQIKAEYENKQLCQYFPSDQKHQMFILDNIHKDIYLNNLLINTNYKTKYENILFYSTLLSDKYHHNNIY